MERPEGLATEILHSLKMNKRFLETVNLTVYCRKLVCSRLAFSTSEIIYLV